MKFAVLAALCASARAFPFVARQAVATPEQIAALAPALGAFPDTNPNSGGDCDGPRQANGQIPRVPCACPPLQDAYIKALTTNVLAGHAVNNTVVHVSFPTGDTVQDKHGRITAAIITLQNLNGPGRGCPGVSTTLGIQSNNLDACGNFECGSSSASTVSSTRANAAGTSTQARTSTTSAPAPVAPATSTSASSTSTPAVPPQGAATQAAVAIQGVASTVTVTVQTVVTDTVTVTDTVQGATSTPAPVIAAVSRTSTSAAAASTTTAASSNGNGTISRDLVDQLAPQLGSQPNNNPNRFGDCDGPRQPNGQIPHVPCACPPVRSVFIDQLLANIEAGHAVHNPSVRVSFPTSNSKADQHARITAATITLQNLNGPGKGCPNVATTFAAQSNAIGN